jgi:hypothetical protein
MSDFFAFNGKFNVLVVKKIFQQISLVMLL